MGWADDLRALGVLARPRLAPFVLLLPVLGYGWAHWDAALPARGGSELAWVLLAWLALHSGTLWLNAGLDRDEGEVLLGRSVPPPTSVWWVGRAALVVAVGLAASAGWMPALAAGACALLAEAYSNPRIAWKAHPWWGPVVNVLGYGLLSPFAGWSVVGAEAGLRTLVMAGVCMAGILGCTFVAQAFQEEEDRHRGYRTYVAVHGAEATLRAARVAFGVGFVTCVVLAVAGWLPRACLVAAAVWPWVDRGLVRWARQPGGGDASWAVDLARRLAVAGLVVFGAVFAEYARASWAGEPVAGLGTVAGHPSADKTWRGR